MPQQKTNAFGDPIVEANSNTNAFGDALVDAPHAGPTPAEQAPQTLSHGITEFAKQVNPLPMITGTASAIAHPLDTAHNIYNAQKGELAQVPSLVREGRYSEAVGHGTAGLLPIIGPAAAKIGEQGGGGTITGKYGEPEPDPSKPPDPVGAAGAGAGMITSMAAAPALTRAAGRAFQATARPLVKSALQLPGKAESYGARPAVGVLEDTTGVRPETIAKTGQAKITDLARDLDTKAQQAEARGMPRPSLQPARNTISGIKNTATGFNSSKVPGEVADMHDFLTKPEDNFQGVTHPAPGAHTPITYNLTGPKGSQVQVVPNGSPNMLVAAEQPAPQFLGMKRQFDKDFIRNWNPQAMTKGRLGIARQAYHDLADEFERSVPGAEAINQRIQNLVPAVERADAVSHNAGPMQKFVDRFSRPTGALTPALIGERLGGLPGALAGLATSEAISDPVTKMLAARSLYGTGKLLRRPITGRGIQALPVLSRAPGRQ
jgi:hypothetical protein